MPKGRDIDFKEEMKIFKEWLENDTCDEYYTKVSNKIQVNFTNLDEEFKFMDERLTNQKVHIQHAQLESK